MRHRFNQYSCCPSFEKSYKSMTEIPSGNTGFLPHLFSLSSSSSYLPVPTMANLPLNESRLFAMLSGASLCTEAACFPACLLMESFCPHPEPD